MQMYGKDFGIPNIKQYLTVCSIQKLYFQSKKEPSKIWNCRFFAIYLHRGWDERIVLKVQNFLMFNF